MTAAYYNLMAAAVATLPAVATGLLAWQWQLDGARLRGNPRLHPVLGLLSSGMIWLTLWVPIPAATKAGTERDRRLLAAQLIAAVLITLTGHLGGILSGVEVALNQKADGRAIP